MTKASASRSHQLSPSQIRRLAIGAGAGTSLEFYDFAIYGVASALIFPKIFFSGDIDPWFASFLSLLTYTVGFVAAPVGAIVMGWVGDTQGRRRAMLITFWLMGGATVAMGLLPTYESIGVAAPVALVMLRLVHGFSRGGELGGASVLAVEHAPLPQRAAYGAFVALGSPIAANSVSPSANCGTSPHSPRTAAAPTPGTPWSPSNRSISSAGSVRPATRPPSADSFIAQ